MSKIHRVAKGAWYSLWGHLFAAMFYDTKYLQGKWFAGKLDGMCSVGWQWVTHDALSRIFTLNNRNSKFPVSNSCRVVCPENIEFHPDDLNNFQSFGIYFQAIGKISIGRGTYIGPNVGLITANHNPKDLDEHQEPKGIVIGEKCWIGMNAVILPGVELGDNTVVGAGAVVTKSFPEGKCVIAGNPAVIKKKL